MRQIERVTLTPDKAKQLLEQNPLRNRPIRTNHVVELAADMAEERWIFNGDTIKLGRAEGKGFLIDGQHRLLACIAAGVSFETIIVRDLPDGAVKTTDCNAVRSVVDALHMAGVTRMGETASWGHIARMLDSYARFGASALYAHNPVSRTDVLDYATENVELVTAAHAIGKQLKDVMPITVSGTVWALTQRANTDKSNEFFGGLMSGQDLPAGSPVLALRARLLQARMGNRRYRLAPRDTMGLVIRAWNAFIAGEDMDKITVRQFDPDLALTGVPVPQVAPGAQQLMTTVQQVLRDYSTARAA